MNDKLVLLVNVGTPEKANKKAVRKFLRKFLNDPRVIDISALARFFLVNFIIIPFRTPKSTRIYKNLYHIAGSPLLENSYKVQEKLNTLPSLKAYDVFSVMSYSEPKMESLLKQKLHNSYKEIVLIPLYPQYASSTSGSVIENFMKMVQKWQFIPSLRIINDFFNHPLFIKAFSERLKSYHPEQYDHILFSFHGLPERQIHKIHPDKLINQCNCHISFHQKNRGCYRAACYETARLIAKNARIEDSGYTVTFQSRLSDKWLSPFTDATLKNLPKKGVKNILVLCPSFVSDCLETIVEIGSEYKNLFKKHGGEKLQLVESLNDHQLWINTLEDLILNS
jgi:ferrochelatase